MERFAIRSTHKLVSIALALLMLCSSRVNAGSFSASGSTLTLDLDVASQRVTVVATSTSTYTFIPVLRCSDINGYGIQYGDRHMVVCLGAKRFNIMCHLALPLIKGTFFPRLMSLWRDPRIVPPLTGTNRH